MLRRLSKLGVRWAAAWLTLFLLLGSTLAHNAVVSGLRGSRITLAEAAGTTTYYQPNTVNPVFLPFTSKSFPWSSPFGVEVGDPVNFGSTLLDRAASLPAKWMRLNQRISWRQLQPNEGDPIQWDRLTNFEDELRALQAYNITPIVIVDDYPAWATAERGGSPSYCGPMRADKFGAFADFVSQLVSRYKGREFNAHIWELGNEPDVDGSVYNLPLDSEYGCWGDASDTKYYGGQLYGEMLKIVTPAIKAADPFAQVWIGGLLLNSPLTQAHGEGRPELFLTGILQAGVNTDYSYFDVVPYHAYTFYSGQDIDYDNADTQSPWFGDPWGGSILGKARFLRDAMSSYGVQKPLFADEISLTCPDYNPSICTPPVDAFFEMQANHLVRVQVRGLSDGITGFAWYTLDGPGWRYCGLLDGAGAPRPSYLAYQQLVQQLINAEYLAPVDYGADFEAYAFRRGAQEVHIVWSKADLPDLTILVPAGSFVDARSRDGTPIAPVLMDGNYQIPVGFAPVYVVRNP